MATTDYRLDGGAWAQGTSVVVAPGAHVVEYRSTDGAGNAEAPKSAPVRVTIREEQTNPLISFTGPWFITNHANLSGGSTKQVSALGAAATIVFNGTRLDWVTSRAASYGKARVIVDCGTPVEVDLYSASSQFKQTVFSTGDLQSGDHTLRIEYTGTKNASSSGNTIGLDALDVTGRLLQADRTAPVTTITAPTTWQSKSATVSLAAVDDLSGVQAIYFRLDSGGSKTYTAPFAVSGSGSHSLEYWAVDTIGNSESTRTRAVNVDLDSPSTSSNAAASYTDSATVVLTASDTLSGIAATQYRLNGGVWTAGASINTTQGGNHVVDFRSSDVAGNVEGTKTASFAITKRVEQTDPLMAWTGAWATTNHANLSGGNFRSASDQLRRP